MKLSLIRALTPILISVILCNCSNSQGENNVQDQVSAFLKKNESTNFQSFKNWQISKRDGMLYLLVAYKINDSVSRAFLVKKEERVRVKVLDPKGDNDFHDINSLDSAKFKNLGVDVLSLKRNIDIFFDSAMDKISYRQEIDGILISKENLSLINLLSSDSLKNLPKKYKLIQENWYLYQEN